MRRLILACLLLLAPLAATATTLALAGDDPRRAVAAHVEILEDPGGRLGIDDIRRPEHATRFIRHGGDDQINFGYSASAWWLRLTLVAAAGSDSGHRLEVGFPTLDRIAVFPAGDAPAMLAGDELPFAARPIPHRNFVFPLRLTPGEAQTVHLRVVSAGSLTVPLTLWTAAALHTHDQTAYAAHALYFGMLVALGLYNLLLWLSLRERSYLAYVAFVAAMAVGQLALSGLGYQYLWSNSPGWEAMALNTGFAATGFFGALFTRIFLGTPRHYPGLDRIIVGLATGFVISALGAFLIPYRPAAITTSLLGVAFSAVAVLVGFLCLRRGDTAARFFLLAWALLLAGVAAMGLRNMALLPTNFITVNAIQIGSALEVLLLSFALADRIQLLRRDKETAQAKALRSEKRRIAALERNERELEARVAQRTGELSDANARLLDSEARLRELAHHDALTGLANRTLLVDRLQHALQRGRRHGSGFAVLLIDLDEFKAVNDEFGHDAGDTLLIAIGQRLRDSVRAADTVARLGGDEFVIVLEDAGALADVNAFSHKLGAALRQPVPIGRAELRVDASIGAAVWPADGDDPKALLRAADQAMYAAKHRRREVVEATAARC